MGETKRCPYCSEEILIEAKKCKHCGEFLDEDLRNKTLPNEAKVVVKEGCFLQTLNAGCVIIVILIGGIILALFLAGLFK